ncbi:peroxisome assembly protein 12-like [Oppia nitens]|uniref:peroxisome assembly protein 12-like n=1 Tax=Oppia nitens TaxID=1686743 RepID=UPI0023DCCBA7|nr:peroxisome assembly protein 12-like [Oppia nitens]
MSESSAANKINAQSVVTSDTSPSIFEVLAQQSLDTGLRRAANYLINILYSNNNQKFWFLYKNFDELYFLFSVCVQWSHLKAFNASFAEHFYSLKRISNDGINSVLKNKHFYSSLIVLTLFPYLKTKFESLYENLKLRQLESQSVDNSRQELKEFFLKTYPMVRIFGQLFTLYYEISYTVGQNGYHSPLLRLSNVKLINLGEEDLNQINDNLNTIDNNDNWLSYLSRLSLNSTKCLSKGFGGFLSVSAFFIQFLEYWYNTDMFNHSFAPLSIPPAPQKMEINVPIEKCPICLNMRQNDTALMTSGFVFCYSCIVNHLRITSQCPVTGYPSTADQIIKLYPPEQ